MCVSCFLTVCAFFFSILIDLVNSVSCGESLTVLCFFFSGICVRLIFFYFIVFVGFSICLFTWDFVGGNE